MEKQITQVREFHEVYGVPFENSPTLEIKDKLKLNLVRMLSEEVQEAQIAIAENDLVGLSKEFADIMYVLIGGVDMFGMSGVFENVFDEVHESNMSKSKKDVKMNNGNGGQRVEKSEGYKKANLDRFFNVGT